MCCNVQKTKKKKKNIQCGEAVEVKQSPKEKARYKKAKILKHNDKTLNGNKWALKP